MDKLKKIIKEIELIKGRMGKDRDRLRGAYLDLQMLIESIERGDECLEEAQELLDNALDAYSEQL